MDTYLLLYCNVTYPWGGWLEQDRVGVGRYRCLQGHSDPQLSLMREVFAKQWDDGWYQNNMDLFFKPSHVCACARGSMCLHVALNVRFFSDRAWYVCYVVMRTCMRSCVCVHVLTYLCINITTRHYPVCLLSLSIPVWCIITGLQQGRGNFLASFY